MQEVDDFGLTQSTSHQIMELESVAKLALVERGNDAESVELAASEQAGMEDKASQLEQNDRTGVGSSSAGQMGMSEGFSVSNISPAEEDGTAGVIHEMGNQPGEVVNAGASNEKDFVSVAGTGHLGENQEESQADRNVEACKLQYGTEESFVFVDKSHEDPVFALPNSDEESVKYPGVSSISFPQLLEAIKGLDEDDYKLLLMSRKLTGSSMSLQHDPSVLMERLSKELFLTSCEKDILHLQLTEQLHLQTEYDRRFQQLDGEISVLQASLGEAKDRCKSLAEEVAQCKSELQATVSGREELQLQLHGSKAEVEEISARANELHNSLEKSQSEVLTLSKESADSKGLVGMLHAENEKLKQVISLLNEERKKLVEENNACIIENEKLMEELADCKNLVGSIQLENSHVTGTLTSLTEKYKEIEEEKEYLANGNDKLSAEISAYKYQMEALVVENVNLMVELAVVAEDRNKILEDKDFYVQEVERFSSELLFLHKRLTKDNGERKQLEVELKEMMMHLQQRTGENMSLRSSLEIHMAKLKEIDDVQAQRSSVDGETQDKFGSLEVQNRGCENEAGHGELHKSHVKQDGEASFSNLEKPMSGTFSGVPPHKSFEVEVFDDSLGFDIVIRKLEDAEKILIKLEKDVEEMYSHPGFLSRPLGKVTAPAVSKLIQAFESKSHHEEQEAGETVMSEDQLLVPDAFASVKSHAQDLKAVLKQLASDALNASLLFKSERDGRDAANGAIKELKFQFDAMEGRSNDLEAANIEFEVLYEAVKQHVFDIKEKDEELEGLCETLKQENKILEAENNELVEKLSMRELRINELQNHFHDLQLSSDELASVLRGQLVNFQKAAADKALKAEQEWNSVVAQINEAIKRLDSSTGYLAGPVSTTDDESMDLSSYAKSSVNAAVMTIGNLKEKLQIASSEHEAALVLLKEVNEKYDELLRVNGLTSGILERLYCDLRKLVIDSFSSVHASEIGIQDEKLFDPIDYNIYKTIMEQLEDALAERMKLQSINDKLNLELISTTKAVEELNRRCADLCSMEGLIECSEGAMKLEDGELGLDGLPILRLESLVSSLVHKCQEADKLVSSTELEKSTELLETINQLTALKLQHETEILLLKECIGQVEGALFHVQSELQEKMGELEQSEQRVSSLREKLGIAVTRGKGLVNQRDSLKQSLSEISSELERCSQELQSRDDWVNELEIKLKSYSEAGERVEALESELTYIRNSATALRESFLLKDSVLQRIEEILEDLDLPEHFHSRDIIEKVDWLARSATGNSLPPADLDQKGSIGSSYSDAGFVMMDEWKQDMQATINSGDDLRRKYEDLQGKFCGLAEQNEMLEQSLMERNQLVQRWEELLDRIDMPAHLRSMEPEDRIKWMGSALSEANRDRDSLLQSSDKLKNYCDSLTADTVEYENQISLLNAELEKSQKKVSDIESDLQAVTSDRENLSERLEILHCDYEKLSAKLGQFSLDNRKLQTEVSDLQEQLVQTLGSQEYIQRINGELCRLQDLVYNALKDPGVKGLDSGEDSIKCLEGLLMKLIEKYVNVSVEEYHGEIALSNINGGRTRGIQDDADSDLAPLKRDTADSDEANVAVLKIQSDETNVDDLKKQLEETLSELVHVKDERDGFTEKQQSLIGELEALERQRMELQELLRQEEQKSTSSKEKLNIAVRKGKSLVQQRDSLKKMTEELSAELEHLKSKIQHRENALAEYELKMRDLACLSERVEALESENLSMRNHLVESSCVLQDKEHSLSMILNALGDIDVGVEIYDSDPVKKLEHIGKLCHDLHAAVISSEKESRKSRRAAELLLTEMNEVQDRNDGLQEDLAKVTAELMKLSKDRDVAEADKLEALSHVEKLTSFLAEEKKRRNTELVMLKSAASQLKKSFSEITVLLSGLFSQNLELLQNLQSDMESCLRGVEVDLAIPMPSISASDGIATNRAQVKVNLVDMDFSSETAMPDHFDDDFMVGICNFLQEVIKDNTAIKVALEELSITFNQQGNNVSKLMGPIQRAITSQKESFEAIRRDIRLKESVEIEKDSEIVALRRNITLLCGACSNLLMAIESKGSEVTSVLTVEDWGIDLKPATFSDDGVPFGREGNFPSEEHVKDIVQKLLAAVKNFASLKREVIEGENKEMKIIISSLQKELQEKDIQRERICEDLVSQVKQAETAATNYSIDLQSTKSHVNDLEKRMDMILDERNLLEQRVNELQDQQTSSTELLDKINSLTDMLSAKDQEIEALMQALDEEEVQMEDLTKRVGNLEEIVQQKNLDIENLEASHRKAVKKLSITVSKFDELHLFSESLVAEVEKLQSQLQDRDSEISFLRQEVTRCTNDTLVASHISSRKNSDEILEFLTWLGTLVSLDVNLHDSSRVQECKEIFQKRITSILSELEDLRVAAQTRDALLQVERTKVEDLTRREETLEKSLREKEFRLDMLAVTGEMGQPTNSSSEILEVEPVINKWKAPGPSTTTQVRSLRKSNNDQVAIAIDMDPGSTGRQDDEDDEKVHGFKSLTSSRIVPKFTRPVTDMIDGLWVSCDRALMRQPALRLGIMIYWAMMHALLAAFVV